MKTLHLPGMKQDTLACYARLFASGLNFDGASIGRVVTSTGVRGGGFGRELIQMAIAQCEASWPGNLLLSLTISTPD